MSTIVNQEPQTMKHAPRREASSDALAACPLCGGRAHLVLPLPGHWIGAEVFGGSGGSGGPIGLVRCRGCGLVFTNPRPSAEQLDEYYAGNTYVCHETAGSASGGAKAAFVLDRTEAHLAAGAPRTLLDYGAGGGGFLLHARDRGWKVQGFEPGRRGLETCRGLGLDVTGDAKELPSGKFGLVTMHHVFEHLAEPIEVLRDVKRLMATDGRLFIEVPNAGSLRARMALPALSRRCGVDERYRAFPIHLMYYTDRTLRGMLDKGGWDVEATFTIGLGVDEFFSRASSSLRPKGGSGEGAAPPAGRRRFRRRLRDAFLSLGMGENLVAIASPRR